MATATKEDPCLGCGQVGSVGYKKCQVSLQSATPMLCSQVFSVDPVTGAKQAIKGYVKGAQQNIQNYVTSAANQAVQGATNAILNPIEQWLPSILERVGLFLFALVLVVSGFFILKG